MFAITLASIPLTAWMANTNNKHDAYNSALRNQQYATKMAGLTAYERHKLFVSDYLRFYSRSDGAGPGPSSQALAAGVRTDYHALKEGHRFIRTAQDDAGNNWETRVCKNYYDRQAPVLACTRRQAAHATVIVASIFVLLLACSCCVASVAGHGMRPSRQRHGKSMDGLPLLHTHARP